MCNAKIGTGIQELVAQIRKLVPKYANWFRNPVFDKNWSPKYVVVFPKNNFWLTNLCGLQLQPRLHVNVRFASINSLHVITSVWSRAVREVSCVVCTESHAVK
jgi:hypothetical protein